MWGRGEKEQRNKKDCGGESNTLIFKIFEIDEDSLTGWNFDGQQSGH